MTRENGVLTQWFGQHCALKIEILDQRAAIGIGIDVEESIIWLNFLIWTVSLFWNIQPGRTN